MLPDWMILGIAFIVIVLAFAFVCRSGDAPARDRATGKPRARAATWWRRKGGA